MEQIFIYGFIIIATIIVATLIYKVLVFLVSTNIFSKTKITQNLDNWIGKYFLMLTLLIVAVSSMTMNDEQLLYVVGLVFVVWIILDRFNLFSCLDKELFKVFNEDKGWFATKTAVYPRFLDEDTYTMQNKKIKFELDQTKAHSEQYHKLDNELSQTLNIITNINEIYKKSLKNLTTMSKNKVLLEESYNELESRYQYFETKYHELLNKNYSFKNDISTVQKNDNENEELKNNLKNI